MLFGKKTLQLRPPFSGEVVPISDVPDPVFAQGMLGDGFAVIPEASASEVTVCSPVDGKLVHLFDTLHACVIRSREGVDILIHIGLETVGLKGAHFRALASKDDNLSAGAPLVSVDVAAVRAAGLNPITPVVFSSSGQIREVKVHAGYVDREQTCARAVLA